MSKVEDGGTIPESGQQRPKSEAFQAAPSSGISSQKPDNEDVMSLEMALVRALQHLGETTDLK